MQARNRKWFSIDEVPRVVHVEGLNDVILAAAKLVSQHRRADGS
jgi:hypothetical protein